MTTPVLALTQLGCIRLALAALCVLLLVLTFESIRRTALKERYALLWIAPCVLLLLLTAFPGVLDWMRHVFGMTYASSVSCVVFVSLLAAVFYFSRAISKTERNLSKIAQRCASLEARVRELEKQRGPDGK